MSWKILVYKRLEEVKSLQKVADEIGYARCSLSMALNDKYVGSTKRLEQAVFDKLSKVQCPHLCKELSTTECQQYSQRSAPTQNPLEMRHWRACQNCPLNRN